VFLCPPLSKEADDFANAGIAARRFALLSPCVNLFLVHTPGRHCALRNHSLDHFALDANHPRGDANDGDLFAKNPATDRRGFAVQECCGLFTA